MPPLSEIVDPLFGVRIVDGNDIQVAMNDIQRNDAMDPAQGAGLTIYKNTWKWNVIHIVFNYGAAAQNLKDLFFRYPSLEHSLSSMDPKHDLEIQRIGKDNVFQSLPMVHSQKIQYRVPEWANRERWHNGECNSVVLFNRIR